MIHIAIMKKSWGLTEKILAGEKTIETRWYKNRLKPWNCIKKRDEIYFKDSGEPVTVKAEASKIEQYEDLNDVKIRRLMAKFSTRDLGTTKIPREIKNYVRGKRYAIIIHLKNPRAVKPFYIDKTGFGAMSAWLCVDNLSNIMKRKQ